MNAAPLANDEADFFRSPFILLCLTIGPAIGFVVWLSGQWLLAPVRAKALPMSVLFDGTAWVLAYVLGLHFVVPAIVIFVVIGLVFKYAGFDSMLVSAALAPIFVAGLFYIQGGLRLPAERVFTGFLNFLIPSIAAMTMCWLLAGAIRALRSPR